MAFPILGSPKPQFFDSSGAPLASGTLEVVEPATDVDKATYPTYDDAEAATNANSNPITLDARGECSLWGLDGEDYKLTLKDAEGNTIWTADDIFLPVQGAIAGSITIPSGGSQMNMVGQSLQCVIGVQAYTRNATVVEDRTLLASASATATNNNNVLAALIADLQAKGIIA